MFPTRLNVIAPDKRRHIDRMLYMQFAKGALEALLVILCAVAMTLLGGLWVLQMHFNDLVERLTAVTNQQTQKNAKMKEINTVLERVETIQKEYVLWLGPLADLANATPDNIILLESRLNDATDTYTLNGTAATRDALLLFQAQLEDIPYVETVDVPLSQLTERKDIRFSITVTRNEDAL